MSDDLELESESEMEDDNEQRIENYASRSLDELKKITPQWAIGEKQDLLLNYGLHPKNNKYKTYFVKTDELLTQIVKYNVDMSQLFLKDESEDYRIMTTLERWERNECVDPPILSIDEVGLIISDGRHRTKICAFLDIETIPVAIHSSHVLEVAKKLNLILN